MKKRILLLLCLLGAIAPLSVAASPFPACAEGDGSGNVPEELEYEDTVVDGYYRQRTYTNITIADIEENFRAPSGSVLTLAPDHDALARIREDIRTMEMFASGSEFSMINLCVYRKIGDAEMYASSDSDWSVSIDDFESHLEGKLPSLVLYEIEEKIADVDLSARIEIALYSQAEDSDGMSEYHLLFDVDAYHVKKYVPGDILNLNVFYYSGEGDARTTIRADYDENLFNDKYGFKTDGRAEKSWDPGNYYEIYSIRYYDKVTNVILDTDDAYDTAPGVEILGIPREPMTVFAVMTFKQDGTEYTFLSNEVTVCEQFTGLLVDGYNNRTAVGVNETHQLSLAQNLDYGSVTDAAVVLNLGDDTEPLISNVYSSPESEGDLSGLIDEDENMRTFDDLNDDFFRFDFTMDRAGDYVLEGMIVIVADSFSYYGLSASFSITVTDTPTSYTPLNEALTLNHSGNINCVAGGNAVSLEAAIAPDVLNDGDEPVFEWSMSRLNVVELQTNGNQAIMNTVGGGVVTVTCTCTTKVFGSISQSVTVNAIDDIYSIASLDIPDEFHYSGKDLTIGVKVEKYADIINFVPDWTVTNKAGEDVPFTDNGNASITIEAPVQDDYTIAAFYNGVELDSKTVEVRTVNTDEFVRKNLVWIVLVTLAFVGLTVFLKVTLDRKGSLSAKVGKTLKQFEAIDRDSASLIRQLSKVKLSVLGDIGYAKNLNMTAMNEYEKTIRYLGKSLADIKEITRNKDKMTPEQFNEAYDKLTKDLAKARNVAKEIEDAKAQSLSNSLKANENNIVRMDGGSKPNKDK